MRLYNNGRLYVKKYNLSVQFLLTSALCMKQAGLLQQDEAEISALKKQVMELTLSVNEYKRRLSKIEELSRL